MKLRQIKLVIFLTLYLPLLVNCGLSQTNSKTVLVDQGKTDYQIVVADKADAATENAARQLSAYLLEASKVSIPITTLSKIDTLKSTNLIYVGFNDNVTLSTLSLQRETVTSETIILKSLSKNSFLVAGGSSRATLYAVFELLEKHLGFRWWTPKVEEVPSLTQISLPPLNYIYTPPFCYRSHFIHSTVSDAKFATIMRQNGYNQPVNGDWGGRIEIVGWAHTFSSLLPVKKYFKSHPEWYADPAKGDKPCSSKSAMPEDKNTQLCLENEDLFQEFLNNTLEWIQSVKSKNPTVNIFSISINDNQRYCRCEECLKTLNEERSPSGSLIKFLNKLVVEVNKSFPDVKLETLAYFSFFKAPKNVKPHPNVLVMVAPVEADYGKGIGDHQNEEVRSTFMDWGKISNGPFYWGYNTNFSHLLMPHPTLFHIQDDLIFLKENSYKGVFLQDNRYTDGVGYFLDLQTWVIGKLLWDPTLNQNELVDEFLSNYYGDAGIYMKKYIEEITSSYLSIGNRLETFNNDFSFVTPDLIQNGELYFKQAYDAVKGDPILLERVEKEKISFEFMKMIVYNPVNERAAKTLDGANQVDKFYRQLDKFSVKNIDFSVSKDSYRSRLQNIVERNNGFRLNEKTGKIAIQESNFTLLKKGSLTEIVNDRQASDGSAAIILKTGQWAIQNSLSSYSLILKNNNWAVRFYVRAELEGKRKSSKDLGSVEFGIYNSNSKAVKTKFDYKIAKLASSRYIEVDLSELELVPSDILFVAVKNPESIKRLYVDKIELIKVNP